ncbi:MAG: hypothetical protein LBT11_06225 [Treponema sp.]|nr:hypothetical protein [Treponema sp.]
MIKKFCLICLCGLFLAGCTEEAVLSIEREDHFSLKIGRLEDELDLFGLWGNRSIRRTGIAMRDGLFYIANGNGQKIGHYNSYGDMLFMIYNEENNPPPLSLATGGQENGAVTKWAYAYPLEEPGLIIVDSRKHIYAEDRFPYEMHSYDSEKHVLLDSMVLHFDEGGRFVEYLGQEGVGGSPFPHIEGLYTSANDELGVICRLPEGWNIYWFTSDGMVSYVIRLRNEAIPVPQDRPDVFGSVDTIIAAPDGRRLFIKVDYYRLTYDESTNTRSGSECDSSVLWVMDVETGAYLYSVEVPLYEFSYTENGRRLTENLFYSIIGAASKGRIFLSFPAEGGYSILILSADTRTAGEQRRSFIQVNNEELQYTSFSISEDGILSALLATNEEVRVVWWRTDRVSAEMDR